MTTTAKQPGQTVVRLDVYYDDGTCKTTASPLDAENWQLNNNEAVISHPRRNELRRVNFIERKEATPDFIDQLAKQCATAIGKMLNNEDSRNPTEIIAWGIAEALHQQKVMALTDLLANCDSDGYQMLFDMAGIIQNKGKRYELQVTNQAADLIREAAQKLLKSGVIQKTNQPKGTCIDCHYSGNGTHGCNRMMSATTPKIDLSKGVECAYNGYVHYLKFGSVEH